MSKESLETWQNRQISFGLAAIKDGAHKILPPGTSEKVWADQKDTFILYTITPFSQPELAQLHGETKAVVSDRFRKGVTNLYNNLREGTQREVPLESLLRRKPMSLHVRERLSLGHGGAMIAIRRAIENGAKTRDEIADLSGESKRIVYINKENLKDLGVNIHRQTLDPVKFKAKLEKTKSYFQERSLLYDLSPGSLRWLGNNHKDIVRTLGSILGEMGFSKKRIVRRKEIVEIIREANIPVVTIRTRSTQGEKVYYYLSAMHTEEVKDLLKREFRSQMFDKRLKRAS